MKTTVLLPSTNTASARCHRTARANTSRSKSRPLRIISATESLWLMRVTSCSSTQMKSEGGRHACQEFLSAPRSMKTSSVQRVRSTQDPKYSGHPILELCSTLLLHFRLVSDLWFVSGDHHCHAQQAVALRNLKTFLTSAVEYFTVAGSRC